MAGETRRAGVLTRSVIGAIVVGTVCCSGTAWADNLDDRRADLNSRIADSNAAIGSYETQLDKATQALVESRQELAGANAKLAKARSDREAAEALHAQRTSELEEANSALDAQKKKVEEGREKVSEQQQKAAADLRVAHQQNTGLVSIGMLFGESSDLGDVSSRLQWAQTLYNVNSSELNRLTDMQFELQRSQDDLAGAEDKARVARESAAQQEVESKAAEQAEADATAEVERLVAANKNAEAKAQQSLATEKQNNAAMQSSLNDVTAQINARNAAAAAQQQAVQSQSAPAPAPAAPAAGGSGFPLLRPANGPLTSPFAVRVNPVLGYTEMHDGQDIGAGCGTPILAAASGTVIQVTPASASGGWGNRAILDNGVIGGVHVSTGYNHAQAIIVSPGQYVQRGQTIGYIGTTGLSTGCHLHFHVWINGQVSDPARYL